MKYIRTDKGCKGLDKIKNECFKETNFYSAYGRICDYKEM